MKLTEMRKIAKKIAAKYPGCILENHSGLNGEKALRICGALYPEERNNILHEIESALKLSDCVRNSEFLWIK